MKVKKEDKFKKIRQTMKEKVYEYYIEMTNKVFNILTGTDIDKDGGFTKEELANKVFEKAYVTHQELKEIYTCIRRIRTMDKHCLACRNGRYAWAHSEESIVNYRANNVSNGASKVKKNYIDAKDNFEIEGIKSNPLLPIQRACREFGLYIDRVDDNNETAKSV